MARKTATDAITPTTPTPRKTTTPPSGVEIVTQETTKETFLADVFGGKIKPESHEEILLSDIYLQRNFNVRDDADSKLEVLVRSIRAIGVQTPVSVLSNKRYKKGEKNKSGKKYILVAGFRRFAACTEIDAEGRIPAQIYAGNTSPKVLFALNLQENVVRKNLNPMEEARGAEKLRSKGKMSDDQIRSILGWSGQMLESRRKLTLLPKAVQAALRSEKVTYRQATALGAAFDEGILDDDGLDRFIVIADGATVRGLKVALDAEKKSIASAAANEGEGSSVAPTAGERTLETDDGTEEDKGDAIAPAPEASDNADRIIVFMKRIVAVAISDLAERQNLDRIMDNTTWINLSLRDARNLADALAQIAPSLDGITNADVADDDSDDDIDDDAQGELFSTQDSDDDDELSEAEAAEAELLLGSEIDL